MEISPTMHQDHVNDYIPVISIIVLYLKNFDNHSFQYTFSRRINRPGYDQLNPFYFLHRQYLYKQIVSYFLQPEISNSGDITMIIKNYFAVRRKQNYGRDYAHHAFSDSTGIMTRQL